MKNDSVLEGVAALAVVAIIANAFADYARIIAIVVSLIAVAFWGLVYLRKGGQDYKFKFILSGILVLTTFAGVKTSTISAESLFDASGIQILTVTIFTLEASAMNIFVAVKAWFYNRPMVIVFFPEIVAMVVHVIIIFSNFAGKYLIIL